MRVAVFIDGDSLLREIKRRRKSSNQEKTDIMIEAREIASTIFNLSKKHICPSDTLLRIFFYDAPPYLGDMFNPVSGQVIYRTKEPNVILRQNIHKILNRFANTAVRLGECRYIKDAWSIKMEKQKEIISNSKKNIISQVMLNKDDILPTINQKGVDIKIAMDIASTIYKKLADKIVIFSIDSDLTPILKIARIEGLQVVLDTMGYKIPDSSTLLDHLDSITDCFNKKQPVQC